MKYYVSFLLYIAIATAAAKSLRSCPTLCDPIPGILQAGTLEWAAISFSNAWEWRVKVKSLSHVRLFATPWTAAHQAPPSMGFSRQEYWSGVPLPSPSRTLSHLKLEKQHHGQYHGVNFTFLQFILPATRNYREQNSWVGFRSLGSSRPLSEIKDFWNL